MEDKVVVKGRSIGVTTMGDPTATPVVDEAVKKAAEEAEESYQGIARELVEEEKSSSLKMLREQVEQDISEELESRRIKRNRRRQNRNNPVKVSSGPVIRLRSFRPKRNDPCPCGATKDEKPIKFKNCCGK